MASQEPEVNQKALGGFEIVRGLIVLVLFLFYVWLLFRADVKAFARYSCYLRCGLCRSFLLGFSEASREIICIQACGESESQSESQSESKSESEMHSETEGGSYI